MGDKKTKVVLDADVINHFSRGGRLSLLPNILPEFQFIVLDIVKKELPILILADLRHINSKRSPSRLPLFCIGCISVILQHYINEEKEAYGFPENCVFLQSGNGGTIRRGPKGLRKVRTGQGIALRKAQVGVTLRQL